MGIVILKKRYPFSKYLSVFLITVGVIICTLESSQEFAQVSMIKLVNNVVLALLIDTLHKY